MSVFEFNNKLNYKTKFSVGIFDHSFSNSLFGDMLVTPFEKVLKILNKVKFCLDTYNESSLSEQIKYVISKIESRKLYSYDNEIEKIEDINDNKEDIKNFIDTLNEYSERPVNFNQTNYSSKDVGKRTANLPRNKKQRFNTVQVDKNVDIMESLKNKLKQSELEKIKEEKDIKTNNEIIENKITKRKLEDLSLNEQLIEVNYYQNLNDNEISNEIDAHLIKNLKENVSSKNFDIFSFYTKFQDKSFETLVRFILKDLNLYNLINLGNLENFCNVIKNGYDKKPKYHNEIHGVDVGHTLYSFITHSKNFEQSLKFTKVNILSMILAAFCHDIGHPGYNNAFHMNSLSSFSITYNDRSVLENYHASESSRLLLIPENNILDMLDKSSFKIFRKQFIEAILSTDMTHHMKTNSIIKTRLLGLGISHGYNIENLVSDDCKMDNHQEIINFLIHTADLAHNSKPFEISFKWVCNLSEEFWNQGDVEKELNLPISFLCDRSTSDVPKSQIGFLKGILIPSFEILLDMFPELIYTMENINNNLDQWTKMNNDEFQSKKILMEKSSESEDGVGKRKNKKIEFSTNKSKASSLKFEIHYQLINLDETIIDT